MQNDRNRRRAASSFQNSLARLLHFPFDGILLGICHYVDLNIDTWSTWMFQLKDKTLNVSCFAHSLTDGYAESEQPFGVLSDDEVAFASVQGRYHGVPSSLAVLNLQRCVCTKL